MKEKNKSKQFYKSKYELGVWNASLCPLIGNTQKKL
jgi:hypothetical protein